MKNFLVVFALLFAFSVSSQNKQTSFKISGTLIAADDNLPLESATVYMQRVKDSSLVTYTITNQKGVFVLEGKTFDKNLNLVISYIGFQGHTQLVPISKNEVKLGNVLLKVNTNELDEVVVQGASPITVKKDTLEFNVSSFKTKKDANVEDLLKKLPGVEVDEDGKITVNGKNVSNIFVNGKPFFGDDPTITTRNLTKDIISKVQITDTKTKSEAFTGEQGQSEDKTINLTIRKDKNKGVFGRVSAGAGTDERVEAAGMLNIFDNDQRLSVLAGGNNTNSPGFSFGEIEKMFGGGGYYSVNGRGGPPSPGGFGGAGQGITTSKNAGLNYADDLGKKVELSADYFISDSKSENESAVQRENILADSRFFTSSNSSSINESSSHRANIELEIELDSTLRLDIEPSFSSSKSSRNSSGDEESRNDDNSIANTSNTNSFSENEGNNFRNQISLTKRLGKKGAFIRVGMNNEINKTTSENRLNSQTDIFGNNPETINRDQFTDGEQEIKRLSARFTYRLPLKGREWSLDFNYNYWGENQDDIKSTFNLDNVTQEYTDFDLALSTDFAYKNARSVPGIRLNHRKEKYGFSFSGDYVFRTLENTDDLRPQLNLKRNFEALELNSRMWYNFSAKSRMYFRYSLDNRPPSTRQLQPFEDVSNPLNTVTGNPNLEPSNSHRINFDFNNHNFQKGFGYSLYGGGNFTNNQVVANSIINEDRIRTTTYANVDGVSSKNIGGYTYLSKRLDTVRTIRYSFGMRLNGNKSINFNNGVQYASRNTSFSPNVGITFTWKDVLEINPEYNLSFTKNEFDIEQFNNQEFFYHNLGIRTATFLPKGFEWRNDVNYNYNPNIADGFQKSAWFWNATLSYSVLKDKGAISVKAYDLLNQNTNARRIATGNYIQDSQSTVLQQYFMFSFSWKFNSLGSGNYPKGKGKGGYYGKRRWR